MHKTLHIDVDEEITSIIDRVRKADARDIIIVSPKSALLLQSIVNLKLLKKEADRRKKQVMIITQDKVGKKLIEKAGILVQSKTPNDEYLTEESKEKTYEPMYAADADKIKRELQEEEDEKRRIGSNSFFPDPLPEIYSDKSGKIEKKIQSNPEIEIIEEKKIKIPAEKRKKSPRSRIKMSDIIIGRSKIGAKKTSDSPKETEESTNEAAPELPDFFIDSHTDLSKRLPKSNQVSIKKAEKFFRGSRRVKKNIETTKVGGNAKKYFFIFAVVFFVLAGVAAAYFIFPKATLALELKNQSKSASENITADSQVSSINAGDKIIPAHLEDIAQETTKDFDATGTKSGGAKAIGKAVIYNEFSSEDQPLVATTRLETADGKIFRITKNIVVPGLVKVGNDTQPGAIETDIIADQAGEDMNIDPTDFKIPGFQNTPSKYDKFYAKSIKPLTGGSNGATKVITAQDITNAKEDITASAKKAAIDSLKQNMSSDRKILDDEVQVDVLSVAMTDNAGAEKEKFSATAKVKASGLSFSEADVKEILKNDLTGDGVDSTAISFAKPVNYILGTSDNQQKTLKFSASADADALSGLDLENFKKGILGKTTDEAQNYARNFPAIQKMDISFWPFFASRIPMNERRVMIEVN